jgi:hypothetical protein
MMFRSTFLSISIFFVFVFAGSFILHAADENRYDSWSGNALFNGASFSFEDDKWPTGVYPPSVVGFTNAEAKIHLILSINLDHPAHQPNPYEVSVDIDVSYQNETGSTSNKSFTLQVDYDPEGGTTFKAKDHITFEDAYHMDISLGDIKVDGVVVASAPDQINLEAEFHVTRYYDFNCATTPSLNAPQISLVGGVSGGGNVELSWPSMVGAEAYDLEWTYINSYNGNGGVINASLLNYSFRNNATRVTVSQNTYKLDLIFPRGYVIYRVRGVGRSAINPMQRLEGTWSTPESGTVSSVNNNGRVSISTGHHDNLNWSMSATYAEEGKKKEEVIYYDGSMRSRQNVTRSNTEQQTIVGEVIYDFYGRPAVQTLPTPTQSNTIPYNQNFNRNSSNQPYTWRDFAEDGTPCEAPAAPMSTASGSSRFYSPNNPDKEGAQAYVPDAEGYPFSVIEFTPDNTGRIRRQGGVGPVHQLGTNHETKYFHGAPFQEELDKMFGSEVGY